MPNKLKKLTLLKQKVAAMQRDIRLMEHNTTKVKEQSDFLKPINKITNRKIRNTSQRSNSKEKGENYFSKEESRGGREREGIRMRTENNLSSVLKEICNNVDHGYYAHSSLLVDKEKEGEH